MKLQHPHIPDSDDLRRVVERALSRLVDQLNLESAKPLDAGLQRVVNVANPVAPKDAVNLETLNKRLETAPGGRRPTAVSTSTATDSNSNLTALATNNLTLSTSYADVPGMTVDLNRDGKWLVLGNVNFWRVSGDNTELSAQLVVDGTAVSPPIGVQFNPGTTDTFTVGFQAAGSWVVTVSSQPKTAKVQAIKASGSGSSVVQSARSNLVAVWLST